MSIDIDAFVQSVVSRSATLDERIISYLDGREFHETNESQNRLKRWEEQFSPAYGGGLEEWITGLGLSPKDALKIFGSSGPQCGRSLPDWAELLRSLLDGISDLDGCKEAGGRFAGRCKVNVPAALLELYWTVVRCAKRRLKEIVGDAYLQLTDDAHAAFEVQLLERLLDTGRQVLRLQFSIFRTLRQPGLARAGSFPSEGAMISAEDFVGQVPGERLMRIFEEYPVHARHCAVLALNWINTARSLLTRLAADLPEISVRFNAGLPLGLVTGLKAGLSDPHHGGETVVRIDFAERLRIVYKPRSLASEEWFTELLNWVGSLSSLRNFRSPRAWDRRDYGWTEFIIPSPCPNLSAVRRFYWRAGTLLGLVHLTRGVDIHNGNLIASGEYPVLIDLDALWHLQNPDQPTTHQSQEPSLGAVTDSVLRTGLLPGGRVSDKHIYSASALEPEPDMECIDMPPPRAAGYPRSHLPFVGEAAVGASHYSKEIMAGFRWIGRTLLQKGETRQQLSLRLHRLQQCSRRRIYRSTLVYADILQHAFEPAFLKSGIDFSLELQPLSSTQCVSMITDEERRSLEQLDVPSFLQRPSEKSRSDIVSIPQLTEYLGQLSVIDRSLHGC